MPTDTNEQERYRLIIRGFGATHAGHERRRNEDAFGIYELSGFACVADGIAGFPAGDVASQIVVETVAEISEKLFRVRSGGDLAYLLESLMVNAFEDLNQYQLDFPDSCGMATTSTIVWLRPDRKILVLHLGDNRAYLFREGTLERITEDHTLVADLVKRGEVSEEEARVHPQRNVVTRYLTGGALLPAYDSYSRDVRAGDRIILCTDGLTDLVPDARIRELCSEREDTEELVNALIQDALAAGGTDNVTVVVLDLVEYDGTRTFKNLDYRGAVTARPKYGRKRRPDRPVTDEGSGDSLALWLSGMSHRLLTMRYILRALRQLHLVRGEIGEREARFFLKDADRFCDYIPQAELET